MMSVVRSNIYYITDAFFCGVHSIFQFMCDIDLYLQ